MSIIPSNDVAALLCVNLNSKHSAIARRELNIAVKGDEITSN